MMDLPSVSGTRITVVAGLLVVLLVMSGFAQAGLAAAAQSKFTQQIKLIDCTNTSVNSGPIVVANTLCEDAVMPTVKSTTTSQRQLIITGTYDATTVRELRVMMAGRWYVLGQDAELTANGGVWRLDLSHHPPLAAGEYQVTVEVITDTGLLLRNHGSNLITITESESSPGTSPDSKPAPAAPDTGYQSIGNLVWLGLTGIVITVTGLVTISYRRSGYGRRKQWYNKR